VSEVRTTETEITRVEKSLANLHRKHEERREKIAELVCRRHAHPS
jgi:hypothetical protein